MNPFSLYFSAAILIASLAVWILAWKAEGRASALIEWRTAGEMNTAGFNLYRLDYLSSKEVKVNPDLILAAGDVLSGGSYSLVDSDLQSGRVYNYILEEIYSEGGSSRSGNIQVRAGMQGILELGSASVITLLAFAAFLHNLRRKLVEAMRSNPGRK